MNEHFDKLIYESGLVAQGCWDNFDEYDEQAIYKFAELIVRECANIADMAEPYKSNELILKRFGLKSNLRFSLEENRKT